jgi:hypothetical protein
MIVEGLGGENLKPIKESAKNDNSPPGIEPRTAV